MKIPYEERMMKVEKCDLTRTSSWNEFDFDIFEQCSGFWNDSTEMYIYREFQKNSNFMKKKRKETISWKMSSTSLNGMELCLCAFYDAEKQKQCEWKLELDLESESKSPFWIWVAFQQSVLFTPECHLKVDTKYIHLFLN